MQPYKEGTRLKEILKDGWARGFKPEQTREEASLMGFYTTVASIELAWSNLDEEIEDYANRVETGVYIQPLKFTR